MSNTPRGFIKQSQPEVKDPSKKREPYVVDTTLLHDGQVFKNYKQLVNLFGWKYYPPTSATTIAQRKALTAACEWSFDVDENGKKLSNRVLIHRVYPQKRLVVDKRKTSDRALLGRLISRSILEVLSAYNRENPKSDESMSDSQKMYITYGGLYSKIGLVNENYLKGKHQQQEVSTLLELPLQHVYDFYSCTQDNMKDTLQRSLNDLYRQRLVRHRHTKRLVFKSIALTDTNLKGLSDQYTLRAEVMSSSMYATEEQDGFIFHAERQTLAKYGLRNLSDIYHLSRARRQEFFDDVLSYIHLNCSFSKNESVRMLEELDYYYSALELSFYSPFVDQAVKMEKKMSREDRQEVLDYVSHELIQQFLSVGGTDYVEAINQEQLRRTRKNASNRHSKAKRSPSTTDERMNRASDLYLDSIDRLSSAMMDRRSSFEMERSNTRTKKIAIKRDNRQ